MLTLFTCLQISLMPGFIEDTWNLVSALPSFSLLRYIVLVEVHRKRNLAS